jgi:hypothetical protein
MLCNESVCVVVCWCVCVRCVYLCVSRVILAGRMTRGSASQLNPLLRVFRVSGMHRKTQDAHRAVGGALTQCPVQTDTFILSERQHVSRGTRV